MPTISYAQNQEDVILARVFREPTGFYVDVGAAHPVGHSVTKLFYERGWCGVNIEPQPEFHELLKADRPRDVNLAVAVSDRNGEGTFHDVGDKPGCSTLVDGVADALQTGGAAVSHYAVQTLTLDRVCELYADRPIDFLKIDVEGHEREVLLGFNLRKWRPRVLVIEATKPNTGEPAHAGWQPIVFAQGYLFAFFDGLNRYFVRPEDESLIPRLAVCPNVFDDFVTAEVESIRGDERRAVALLNQTRDELHAERDAVAHRTAERESLRCELTAALGEVTRVVSEAERIAGELGQALGDLDRTRGDLGRTAGELTQTRENLEQTRGELTQTRGELTHTRTEFEQTRRERDQSRAEAVHLRGQHDDTLATLFRTQGELSRTAAERDAVEAELLASQNEAAALTRDLAESRQTADDLRAELAAAREEFARVLATMVKRSALDHTLSVLAATRQHLDTLRTHALTATANVVL